MFLGLVPGQEMKTVIWAIWLDETDHVTGHFEAEVPGREGNSRKSTNVSYFEEKVLFLAYEIYINYKLN